jgi:hypothetical protein
MTSRTPTQPSLGKTILHSLMFGSLFVPVTIIVLFGLTLIEWWRYDNWNTWWMWERGGFPCLGLFSIASASFFLHKSTLCRFAIALAVTGFGTIVIFVIGNILMISPKMYKTIEINWQLPEFLLWILVPPWIVACAFLAFRKLPVHEDLSQSDNNVDITER